MATLGATPLFFDLFFFFLCGLWRGRVFRSTSVNNSIELDNINIVNGLALLNGGVCVGVKGLF